MNAPTIRQRARPTTDPVLTENAFGVYVMGHAGDEKYMLGMLQSEVVKGKNTYHTWMRVGAGKEGLQYMGRAPDWDHGFDLLPYESWFQKPNPKPRRRLPQ